MTLRYRLVFFDVDSTLVSIEGIDVLGAGLPEIAELTQQAMNGEVPLEKVYGRRLELIRPSRARIEALGETYVESLVAGAAEVVATLRGAGVQVHLVTAGIAQAVAPLARHLAIPSHAVHAVPLLFDAAGAFAGYDSRSPLTRGLGKETVVRDVRARAHGRAALVGDGVSDLEARPAVDLFIGYGGVQVREKVKQNADVYVEEHDLRALLPHLIDAA